MLHTPLIDLVYCVIELERNGSELLELSARLINSQGHPTSELMTFKPDDFQNFKKQTQDCVLISRNAAFESHLLFPMMEDEEEQQAIPVLDPFYMARFLLPHVKGASLSELGRALGIEKLSSYPPLQRTSALFGKLMHLFQERDALTLKDILHHCRPKPVTRAYKPSYQILHDAFLREIPVVIEYPKRGLPSQANANDDSSAEKAHTELRKITIYGFRSPFMVAHCQLRRALRTFRIDRITSIDPCLDEHAAAPADFNLGQYFIQLEN